MKCMYHGAIVIIISFLVNRGIPISVPEQDREDLNEYAKEVSRLFNDLPVLNKTSEPALPKKHDLELVNEYASVPYVRSYSANERSSPERMTSEDINSISGEVIETPELLETIPHEPPFTIDKGINSSSTTNQSQECLFDRRHIADVFRECIYLQGKLTTNSVPQTFNASQSSTQDYTRFLKYCRKAPQLRSCVQNMIVNKMEHCLDEGVKETVNNVEEITEHIIKFICTHEGDRISFFIYDGGLECLLSRNWRIHMCLSVNLGIYFLLSLFELPSVNLENIKCINLQSAQSCVARELETCEDQASAVIARILFDIAMEVASCDESHEGRVSTTSSVTLKRSSLPSLSDGEHSPTEDIGNLKHQLSSGLDHVQVNDYNSSPLASSQDQHSITVSTRLKDSSVASGQVQLSTSDPKLEATLTPPNHVTNSTMSSDYDSAATATLGIMYSLLIFSGIIIALYKIYCTPKCTKLVPSPINS